MPTLPRLKPLFFNDFLLSHETAKERRCVCRTTFACLLCRSCIFPLRHISLTVNSKNMNEEAAISAFLAGDIFAVAGASTQRHKYGNKCLRCYMQNDRRVYPINPTEAEVEGMVLIEGEGKNILT